MQIQTRRLEKIALLATRQEAEFVSGVLDAADVPYAVVEVDQGLELRVDPDDAPRVRELIERLDVRQHVAESTRQRRGEARGRWLAAWIGAAALVAVAAWLMVRGLSPVAAWVGVGVMVVLLPVLAGAVYLRIRRARNRRR